MPVSYNYFFKGSKIHVKYKGRERILRIVNSEMLRPSYCQTSAFSPYYYMLRFSLPYWSPVLVVQLASGCFLEGCLLLPDDLFSFCDLQLAFLKCLHHLVTWVFTSLLSLRTSGKLYHLKNKQTVLYFANYTGYK